MMLCRTLAQINRLAQRFDVKFKKGRVYLPLAQRAASCNGGWRSTPLAVGGIYVACLKGHPR